ncbi:hypothetical protein K2173_022745 [Erythroxylum novogranatense]|uniref:Ketoreductase domain-containing protein n=1 Tax=Erythroxylum novogranatense TaxID=1862640 RepID=A0AAV8SNH1_9ROSI|nr:hypothetical protein K2173_022745 [Erythroxylum novogranatense]
MLSKFKETTFSGFCKTDVIFLFSKIKNHNKINKVAIITGGASGIGEATALLFAEYGARVVVIADIQDEKGQNLVNSIGTHRSTYIHCDISDESQVKSLVETTVQLYGRLDIMFCNAAIVTLHLLQTVTDFDFDSYEKVLAHAARAMVDGGQKGSIICTSSLATSTGLEKSTDYVMSKCAVLGLMKSASMQLGGHGIRVNCVSPGAVLTPLFCKAFRGESMEMMEELVESSSYMKGSMKAKHVAEAVAFLASDNSEFVNGHNLVVDGGLNNVNAQ